MTTANQSPAERLQRALEEYWPEGCKMFDKGADGRLMFLDAQENAYHYIHIYFGPHENLRTATIAAVASAWFRKAAREYEEIGNTEIDTIGDISAKTFRARKRASEASLMFQSIYEAATEVEQ